MEHRILASRSRRTTSSQSSAARHQLRHHHGGPTWHSLLTVAAMLCTVSPLSAQTALPHNIPDFSQDSSRPKVPKRAERQLVERLDVAGRATAQRLISVVEINPGHTVTIDSTSAVAYTVAVHGTLRFNPAVNTRLTVTNLMVMGDHGMPAMTQVGYLEVGTAANPIAVGRTAEIVIANAATRRRRRRPRAVRHRHHQLRQVHDARRGRDPDVRAGRGRTARRSHHVDAVGSPSPAGRPATGSCCPTRGT